MIYVSVFALIFIFLALQNQAYERGFRDGETTWKEHYEYDGEMYRAALRQQDEVIESHEQRMHENVAKCYFQARNQAFDTMASFCCPRCLAELQRFSMANKEGA